MTDTRFVCSLPAGSWCTDLSSSVATRPHQKAWQGCWHQSPLWHLVLLLPQSTVLCPACGVKLTQGTSVSRLCIFCQYWFGFNFSTETCAFKVHGEIGAADTTLLLSLALRMSVKALQHSYSHALRWTAGLVTRLGWSSIRRGRNFRSNT